MCLVPVITTEPLQMFAADDGGDGLGVSGGGGAPDLAATAARIACTGATAAAPKSEE
jgi:hypothetical protein